MKKIVVAPDSFKGSVSSMEVSQQIEMAVRKVFPDCEVIKAPVADGGEGTVDALVSAMNGKKIACTVNDPLMNLIEAEYGILEDGTTAVIEMASASGLMLLPKEKRNPWLTSTLGTGQLIKDALLRGCRRFLIGIGGSATNDAGTGMLQALGFRFLDEDGKELKKGGQILAHIRSIDQSRVLPQLKEAGFTVACDVNNPFSGKDGAAYVYARQKGAAEEMIYKLDNGLKEFAAIIKKNKHIDLNSVPGAGAAGGLGGAFVAFLQADLKPGIELVLQAIKFEETLKDADLVITGEGKLDRQTTTGKAPAGVLRAAQKQEVPVLAIGGGIEDVEALNKLGLLAVLSVTPYPVTPEEAMKKEFACRNIKRTIEQQLRIIKYYQSSGSS